MKRKDDRTGMERRVTYCLVPRDLAPKLHDALREFYADDLSVRVVVDMRRGERRRSSRRRDAAATREDERRRIRSLEGRRVADRRAETALAQPPTLPRKARRYADRIRFAARIEPSQQRLEDIDSARLVLRYQAGDESAMGELYLRYFDSVYGYAQLALRDSYEAEDVTQQVFTQVFEALSRYQSRTARPFRAWLFRVARNAVIDSLRRSRPLSVEEPAKVALRRDAALSEPAKSALGWLSDGEVSIFVERLPPAQREVIVLRFMLDLSTEELCAVMGRDARAVRQLQSRALRTLEQRLQAVGLGQKRGPRAPMRRRLRPVRVLAARRFALWAPGPTRR